MSQNVIYHTPFQKAHVHFFDYIESFPGLPEGEPFNVHTKRLQKEIKFQYLTMKEEDALRYIKIRDCFSFDRKSEVEFCLKERVGGVSITDAAKFMGYYKYT